MVSQDAARYQATNQPTGAALPHEDSKDENDSYDLFQGDDGPLKQKLLECCSMNIGRSKRASLQSAPRLLHPILRSEHVFFLGQVKTGAWTAVLDAKSTDMSLRVLHSEEGYRLEVVAML